jgi:MerR family redox-sensitive transcriptional activator SoxR
MTIGEVARKAGVATSALRYYEAEGLVSPAGRDPGGRRVYGPGAVDQVGVILFLADVGFTLAEMRRLLESRAESPDGWRTLVDRKIEELTASIEQAQVAKVALEHARNCPEEDLLACPNFWRVVGDRLATGAVS